MLFVSHVRRTINGNNSMEKTDPKDLRNHEFVETVRDSENGAY